ncbi:MAG: hypothetical protein IMW99_09890 [Firmicutes bacterium]|nr:hypothetical protein [Bacillota bacterium]
MVVSSGWEQAGAGWQSPWQQALEAALQAPSAAGLQGRGREEGRPSSPRVSLQRLAELAYQLPAARL